MARLLLDDDITTTTAAVSPHTPLLLIRQHHHHLSHRRRFSWRSGLTLIGMTSLTIFGISALTQKTRLLPPSAHPQFGTMELLPDCIESGTCASTDAPALKGYDPVSFFTGNLTPWQDCGLQGHPLINTSVAGYTFYFVSHDNRNAFIDDPETYWPMFGGFCAWGIAYESMWNASMLGPPAALDDVHYCTEAWDVRFGRLYLLNRGVKALWLSNPLQIHEDAQRQWSQAWYPGIPRLATPVNTRSYIHGLPA